VLAVVVAVVTIVAVVVLVAVTQAVAAVVVAVGQAMTSIGRQAMAALVWLSSATPILLRWHHLQQAHQQ